MEKSGINGEKFVRRTTRAWRLRRHRQIGSSCNYLELLAPHHARLLTTRPPAEPAPPAPLLLFSACESVAVLRQAMRVCSLAAVLWPSAAAPLGGAASGRTGASGAALRVLRTHCDAAESGFIGRRRRLGRALYPPTDAGFE